MCLPVGGLGYSSERMHLSGCAYLPVGLLGFLHLNGCAYQLVAGALAWVRLPVGGLGYSSERVHLNGCAYLSGLGYSSKRVHLSGCAYQLVGLDAVLSGCT